jgi:hypothetical protein
MGRLDEARSVAVDVLNVRVTHPADITATAIAGAAAVLLFNTATWAQADIAEAITGMDTTAAWWRTQTVSSGLVALAERTFKAAQPHAVGVANSLSVLGRRAALGTQVYARPTPLDVGLRPLKHVSPARSPPAS